MSGRMQAGLGGAATGASVGAPFGPYGAAIGAGVGGLAGLMMGGQDDAVMPDLTLSPGSLASLRYGDINLQSMNPELYDSIMHNKMMLAEADRILNSHGGMSPVDRRKMQEDSQQAEERMGGMGILGTPAGEAMMADFQNKLREQAEQRAFQQHMGMLDYAAKTGAQNFDMNRGGLQDVMSAMQANRMNSLAIDKMRQEQNMAKYGGQLKENEASNQFWSGLFNGGMKSLGNMQGSNTQAQMLNARMANAYGPGAYQTPTPYPGLSWGG